MADQQSACCSDKRWKRAHQPQQLPVGKQQQRRVSNRRSGGFYLAKEEWRNAGTINIDPVLAGELKNTTTWPPVVLNGLVTSDVRLGPQAARDTDVPDLGYHYAPIDYAVGTLVVTNNGSLSFGPGVAVVAFGNHGLRIENRGSIRAEGLPTAPVRLFRYNVVQEQPVDWGNTTYAPCILTGPAHDTLGGDAPPVATVRFAEFSGMGGAGLYHHTVRPDQIKEENSTVDIGFHYVAADAGGVASDRDGDGLPDCFEDRNGNGQTDFGETSWMKSDTRTGGPGDLEVFTKLD
ncbi:MAG: hypothetical protein QHJ82_04455 [Verrucomicrobiota bacterium]|nr:hypothetical protein [Verrucomicrobiota bacterium]